MFPSATFTGLLSISRGGDSTTSLVSPVPVPSHTSSEKSFPHTQSKPSLGQVQATSPCPIAFYLEEETSPHLITKLVLGSCREQ